MATKAYDVFVSYAREDKAWALPLAQAIEAASAELPGGPWNVFFDIEKLRGGEYWQTEIEEAVERCRVFLAILSPAYMRSYRGKRMCFHEYRNAVHREAKGEEGVVFQVLHREADLTVQMQRKQWSELRNVDTAAVDAHPAFRNLVRDLATKLGSRKEPVAFSDFLERQPEKAIVDARKVAVINFKGGVGKTTLTLNLGAVIANRGHRVLLVDLDAQASLTFACILEETWNQREEDCGTLRDVFELFMEGKTPRARDVGETIRRVIIRDAIRGGKLQGKALVPGLDLLPSHQHLSDTDLRLAGHLAPAPDGDPRTQYLRRVNALRYALSFVEDQYDYILFDCPPNLYMIAQNGLFASDGYLVPTIPDALSTKGIRLLRERVNTITSQCRQIEVALHDLPPRRDIRLLGIVATRVGRARGRAGSGIMSSHATELEYLREERGLRGALFPCDMEAGEIAYVPDSANVYAELMKSLRTVVAARSKDVPNKDKYVSYHFNAIADEFLRRTQRGEMPEVVVGGARTRRSRR